MEEFARETTLAAKRELGSRRIGRNRSYGVATRELQKSLRFNIKGSRISFGSPLDYAGFVHWGVNGTNRSRSAPYSYKFPNPSESSRFDILKIHSKKMNLMRGIDLKKIADKMVGASGAEVKACCTEAGMFALRERRVHVTQEDFEMAVSKVMKKDSDKNMSLKKLWK